MNLLKANFRHYLMLLGVGAIITSCASKKDVVYFQDAQEYETIISDNSHVNTFKIDDVISINVSTLDPEASLPFNVFKGMMTSGSRPEQLI